MPSLSQDIVNWHEWVGLLDYGTEGSLQGAEGAVDEHMAGLFGVIANYYSADEPWVNSVRWAVDAERYYAANYPHRNDTDFFRSLTASTNPYLGTYLGTPRAHADQIDIGAGDGGGVHANAALLTRAAYLYTEGGYANAAPDGVLLQGWPASAPNFVVAPIGMQKLTAIAYNTVTTGSFATPLGTIGLGDISQVSGNQAAILTEFEKFAQIDYASCLTVIARYAWPASVCCSVKNAYAGVGLMAADPNCGGLITKVRNLTTLYPYDMLQAAFDAAGDQQVIGAQVYDSGEDVIMRKAVAIFLNGGYDSIYSGNSSGGKTSMKSLTITDGTLIIENIQITGP